MRDVGESVHACVGIPILKVWRNVWSSPLTAVGDLHRVYLCSLYCNKLIDKNAWMPLRDIPLYLSILIMQYRLYG